MHIIYILYIVWALTVEILDAVIELAVVGGRKHCHLLCQLCRYSWL